MIDKKIYKADHYFATIIAFNIALSYIVKMLDKWLLVEAGIF